MLDVIAELKKYKKIDLTQKNKAEHEHFQGLPLFHILNEALNEAADRILSPMAEDIRKMSKNQFKIEQQLEGCFDEIEEITQILKEELLLNQTYQKALLAKDEFIEEIKLTGNQKDEQIQNLVMALISFLDHLELIYGAISASGDQEWLEQMDRVKKSLSRTLQENCISEIGHEKYFNDQLHEVVSLVEDEQRDFREITDIEQKGYLYQGNVLRKAQVIVNNYQDNDPEL